MKSKTGQKTITLILTCLLLITLFAGCGASPASPTPVPSAASADAPNTSEATTTEQPPETASDPLLCRYVVPGSEPIDNKLVDEEITRKLQADGVPLEFSRIYVPWDVWQQKTNVMMTTGEEFEMIHIMEDWIPSPVLVANGGLVPIDEFLPEHGRTLNEMIPQDIWDLTRINGKIYTIPVYFRDFSLQMSEVGVQKQLFEKYTLSLEIKTREELIDAWETIIKNENNPDLRYWFKINPSTVPMFQRGYDSFPFIVVNTLFFVDQQGNVKPWLETDEFRQDCEFYRTMYTKGITHPDLLTIPHEKSSEMYTQGNSLYIDTFQVHSIQQNKPELQRHAIRLNPEKPLFRGEWPIMNGNGISATTQNPQAGVMFFNWLYSSQENHDLLNYGIKDKHWKEAGERRYEYIIGSDGQSPDYSFGDWEMGHHKLVRMSSSASKDLEPLMFEFNPDAVNSVVAGFKFNPEPVSAEYSAVVAELEGSIYPLKWGVISYEEGYQKALTAMKTAGYDIVVAEYQRQFKEWFDAKK